MTFIHVKSIFITEKLLAELLNCPICILVIPFENFSSLSRLYKCMGILATLAIQVSYAEHEAREK